MTTEQSLHERGISGVDVSAAFVLGILLWIAGFFLLFRVWLLTGFDGIFGDEGDARIAIGLLEHWYRFFSGATPDWRSPTFFYPEPGVLGFSDTFFLYSIGYSVLRAAGLDAFTAFMGVIVGLSAIGFAGFMLLAIRHFDASAFGAAVGAFLFTFANMMAMKLGFSHPQSYCAMLLPVIVNLIAAAFNNQSRARGTALAGVSGLLHALVFFTAYLTGWFFTAFAIFSAILYGVLVGRARIFDLWHLAIAHKRHVLIAYAAGFTIGIFPFLWIYVPVLLEDRGRSFDEVKLFAPRFLDIINVGHGNLIWGPLLERAGITDLPNQPTNETELGYSPLVFAVWMIFTASLLYRYWQDPERDEDRFLLTLGLALVGSWLVQVDYWGFSPWFLVWAVVPGASAIRAMFRAQLVFNLAACLLVVIALDRVRAYVRSIRGQIASWTVVGIASVALIAEQINLIVPRVFSRAGQQAWLARIPPPPERCRAFYIVPHAFSASSPGYIDQNDAILVSQFFGLPTINGNSSWSPLGWRLYDPAAPDYEAALRAWADAKGVSEGLCGLEPRTGGWTTKDGN